MADARPEILAAFGATPAIAAEILDEALSQMDELRGEWGGLLALLMLSRFTLEELAAPAAPRMLARCLREVALRYAHRRR
jgi:hypothetical protein